MMWYYFCHLLYYFVGLHITYEPLHVVRVNGRCRALWPDEGAKFCPPVLPTPHYFAHMGIMRFIDVLITAPIMIVARKKQAMWQGTIPEAFRKVLRKPLKLVEATGGLG